MYSAFSAFLVLNESNLNKYCIYIPLLKTYYLGRNGEMANKMSPFLRKDEGKKKDPVCLNIKTSLIKVEGYSNPDMDIDKRSFN